MKLRAIHHKRSSRAATRSFFGKVIIVMTIIVMAFVVPLQLVQKVAADQFDSQISALQQDITKYKTQAAQMAVQAQTLQTAVAQIQAQVTIIQSQINISQVKYSQLVAQIADTEKKIKDSQDALGQTIADIYVNSQVTPLEMLASSKNIGDFVDKQTYRNSVSDQLTATIKNITDLKTQLDTQKVDVQSVLNRQSAQKNSLAASQQQQQTLLSETQGQEAAYQQLVSASQQKLNDAANAQRAYYQNLLLQGGNTSSGTSGSFQWQNLTPGNGSGGCSGGYTYCQAQDSVTDPWQLYNRECVSYVAWALSNRFHKYVAPFHGAGNAQDWPTSAPLYSGAVRVYDPQPGDAVILPGGTSFSPIGHAMVVESSPSSDGWIHVSQFNFYGTGQYSTMDIKSTGVIFLRFSPS